MDIDLKYFLKKELPHDLLAEQIVLSSILRNSNTLKITKALLTPEAFYFNNHQQIYNTVITLSENQLSVNPTSVLAYLNKYGLLKKIGGIKTLIDLISKIPDLMVTNHYINLIHERFLRRTMLNLAYQILNAGYTSNITIDEIFESIEKELFEISYKRNINKELTTTEILLDILNDLKVKKDKIILSGIGSGFFDLDVLTQGFQKSDLIIIAGRPGMGKTAFVLNIARTVAKQNKLPVLFFSLEMPQKQLITRLLAIESSISTTKLKSSNINKREWSILQEYILKLAHFPLFIDDHPNLSISNIRSKVKKIIIEHKKIGIIVIDYLQLMSSSNSRNENRVQELSKITRELKNIAKEFNVPIIALSQLSRSVEHRVNKRPVLSDLRESGSIEQDADLVVMLYRDDYYNDESERKNLAEIIISKHRNGPTGMIQLEFEPEYTRFLNL
jgi:replicative DNA helicase